MRFCSSNRIVLIVCICILQFVSCTMHAYVCIVMYVCIVSRMCNKSFVTCILECTVFWCTLYWILYEYSVCSFTVHHSYGIFSDWYIFSDWLLLDAEHSRLVQAAWVLLANSAELVGTLPNDQRYRAGNRFRDSGGVRLLLIERRCVVALVALGSWHSVPRHTRRKQNVQ